MCAPFAQSSGAVDTSSRPEHAFAEHSLKSNGKSWRQFVMSSTVTPDGVLLVDKAEGMTSHDVVAMLRRKLDIKKVGHCGTLDPLATGLLLITIGRGTKIQDLLMSEDKEYVGTLELGKTTGSQDADGTVIETRPVPDLAREQIDDAFAKFHGDF